MINHNFCDTLNPISLFVTSCSLSFECVCVCVCKTYVAYDTFEAVNNEADTTEQRAREKQGDGCSVCATYGTRNIEKTERQNL